MNTKQLLWNRAAAFIAAHQTDLENLGPTEARKRVVGALYRELLTAHETGVETALAAMAELDGVETEEVTA